ncbi:CFIA complex component [Mycena chlorophos]|uniref:mRNA 3'-end-processing protein RNA14 n=1 Tax=Mycena chlorophos TaxID=658473 RepID=A0A8H6RX25_MYCCL|nr:CFIA complex component [Mycena chlorophos]
MRENIPSTALDAALTRLQQSPHNTEGWKRAVDLAESSHSLSCIRKAYDALLKQFPNNPSAQTAYINHFLVGNKATSSEAEELLNKFLRMSPAVDLWRAYLDYVQGTNLQGVARLTTRETIRKAFEFALNHIGQDRDSGFIHAAYIKFLTNADWDPQQRLDMIRKAFHSAVQIPPQQRREALDFNPGYLQARTVLRQLSNHLSGLNLANPNDGLVLPSPPTFTPAERQLVGRWKAYLKWEESNPLEIEDKDKAILITRVQLVYRKALVRMRYFPEIWFMAYAWNLSVGNTSEAILILEQGLEANPESHALTYAYAEQLELAEIKKHSEQRNFTQIHTVYERFFGLLRRELTRLKQAVDAALAATIARDDPLRDVNGSANGPANRDAPGPADSAIAPPDPRMDELVERQKHYSNAWINYMRFARRAQGSKGGRDVFGKARRDEFTGWEVFEWAALAEYRYSRNDSKGKNDNDGKDVATRIFEMGMKKYADDPQYVLSHLSFLLTINDENNAQALFERVINTFTPQQAKPIWEQWSRSRYTYDDLQVVLDLERRIAQTYPNDAPIKRFAQRHIYHVDPIAESDLGFSKTKKQNNGSVSPHVRPVNGNGAATGNINNDSKRDSNSRLKKRPRPPTDDMPLDFKRPRNDDRERQRRGTGQRPPSPLRREKSESAAGPSCREPPALQPILQRFMAQLPPADHWDGPMLHTKDLIDSLRDTVLISGNKSRNFAAASAVRSVARFAAQVIWFVPLSP